MVDIMEYHRIFAFGDSYIDNIRINKKSGSVEENDRPKMWIEKIVDFYKPRHYFNYGKSGSDSEYTIEKIKNLTFIFRKFEIKQFFELKKIIDESKLNYFELKNLFFFNSGRWDVETNSGIIIKLPKHGVKKALELYKSVLRKEEFKNIKEIDLRQSNQIIINGK